MNNNEIIERIINLSIDLKRPITKKDINNDPHLPSYSNCLFRGIRLSDFKEIFTELGLILTKEVKIPIKQIKRSCLCCKSIFTPSHRSSLYCSRNCSNKHRRTIPRDRQCSYCLKHFYGKSGVYCSQQCHKDSLFLERFLDWYINSKSFGNKSLRDFLKVWKGYFCEVCGIKDWNNKSIVLEVEHKDGNSENSSKENVCLICPNCHSQTDTYKGKNVGNGRHKRRERYREGKSY